MILLGQIRDHLRRRQVDVDCQVLVQTTRRVANNRAQMDDRFDALHRFDDVVDIAKVALDDFQIRMANDGRQGAFAKHEQIEHPHMMAGIEQ